MPTDTNILASKKLARNDVHLLVIDDDDRIRSLLANYLGRCGFRVSTVSSAQDARKLMQTLEFDLLIVDVMMPKETGFDFTASLRLQDDIPIILLTARGEPQDRIEGLKVGADDYLAKPFEPEELVLRIEAIFRRVGLSAPAIDVRFGPWVYNIDRLELTKDGKRVSLTTGEEVLLTLLARRAGAPVSRLAMSEKISAQSARAVDVQMTRLRRKIEDNPGDPSYLLTVRGHGYRLLVDTPS